MPPVTPHMTAHPFYWQTTHYPTLAAYEAALLPFHKPDWIKGITLHHSYSPTVAQWRGLASMNALERFYRDTKGWDAAPHLFLVAGSKQPDNNGIWAGTPLAHPGIHAGRCNADHIGIEIVGNYDLTPWPADVSNLVYGMVHLLMRWGHIPANMVQGHRECLNNKSCPGKMIDMNIVRSRLI
jgi:hypothetical protein